MLKGYNVPEGAYMTFVSPNTREIVRVFVCDKFMLVNYNE